MNHFSSFVSNCKVVKVHVKTSFWELIFPFVPFQVRTKWTRRTSWQTWVRVLTSLVRSRSLPELLEPILGFFPPSFETRCGKTESIKILQSHPPTKTFGWRPPLIWSKERQQKVSLIFQLMMKLKKLLILFRVSFEILVLFATHKGLSVLVSQ